MGWVGVTRGGVGKGATPVSTALEADASPTAKLPRWSLVKKKKKKKNLRLSEKRTVMEKTIT